MKRAAHWVPVLSALAFLVTTSPALARPGNGNANGHNNGGGQGGGVGNLGGGKGGGIGNPGGGKGRGGGAKGSPAPIAGLGILALGAIGYGTRRLQKQKQK